MLGRQSVKVTYAHKRRRIQHAGKNIFSSPLEALPPAVDDLTHSQMARRMLKRSRRVALAEQVEDGNVEHIREHLAKRIKSTQERASNLEPTEGHTVAQDDPTLQTPFPSSQSVHDSVAAKPLNTEQFSPVPVAKRVLSRTSSRNLKENSTRSQVLASPFSSRPGSAASSPKHKGRGRRVSRISLHAKSRTLSGAFQENTRRVSRKDSTASLKDTNGERPTRHVKHRRYPSSPSTAYMRSHSAQEDVITAPKVSSRTFGGHMSPGGSLHSDASFYADKPQSYSTPAQLRARKLPDRRCRQTMAGGDLGSSPLREVPAQVGDPDVDMTDGTIPHGRQTIHLSGNSIFSSSDEFTIRSLAAAANDGATSVAKSVNEPQTRARRGTPREVVDGSQAGRFLTGPFLAEYDVPLPDLDHSPASTTETKMLGPDVVPKLSVGSQLLNLPGTSPARGENLVICSRKPVVAKSSVAARPFGLPGTSPARGGCLIIRTSRNPGTLTPPASPPHSTAPCPPSSPALDLAQELESMDIACGHTHSEGDRPSASIPLQARSHSLQNVSADPTAKKSIKRRSARNRAGTIRASDFAKPAQAGVASESTMSSGSNVRRTRSGTVVGPDSKLAAKSTKLPAQAAKGVSTSRLTTVQSAPESESGSDDELLLKGPWLEDVVYLGRKVPPGKEDAEADELNLGGLWHGLEFAPQPPPRRPGLRG